MVEEWDTDLRHVNSDLGQIDFAVDVIDDFDDFDEDSADATYQASEGDYALRRRSSTQSRISVRAALLRRDSTATAGSSRPNGRSSQKVYMTNEDLTIAVAGFRTGKVRSFVYICLCICTLGLAYLICRWFPRCYVAVVGQPCALKDCEWVVIENQWGELALVPVTVQQYGRPVSTVFGFPDKIPAYGLDDETDPLLDTLRTVDYRYVRFYFHPLKDKFVLCSGWKDANWTDVRLARAGMDGEEKLMRETIFGSNLIDIQQKSIGQLLVDEVRSVNITAEDIC